MATRASLEDKLSAIRKLRGQTLSPEQKTELRKYVGDKSNLVVAAAAAIVGENALIELAKDLEAAFERFLVNPLKDDKLCRAKIGVIQALDKMEHRNLKVFEKAASHVQFEPIWGSSEDSAPPLRAAAVIALARIEGPDSLPRLVDAMSDPAREVRIAAAVGLGSVGSRAAGLLLRLKSRIGDRDSEVLSECLSALLAVDPNEYLAFVSAFLDPTNAERCEAAAIALGKSRIPAALEPLKACWNSYLVPELGQQLLLAIAMLRLPIATDYLIDLVASGSEPAAVAALSALKIHSYDRRVRDRLATAILEKGNRMLQTRFERDFPSNELS